MLTVLAACGTSQAGRCGHTSKSNSRFWHVLAGISCCSRCQGSCALARLTTAAMSALRPQMPDSLRCGASLH